MRGLMTCAALCALLFAAGRDPAPPLTVQFELSDWEIQHLAEWEAPDLAPFLDLNIQKRIARIAALNADPDTARQLNAWADGGPSVTEPGRYGGVRHLIPMDSWSPEYRADYERIMELGPVDLPDGGPGTPLAEWCREWFAPGGGFYDE